MTDAPPMGGVGIGVGTGLGTEGGIGVGIPGGDGVGLNGYHNTIGTSDQNASVGGSMDTSGNMNDGSDAVDLDTTVYPANQ